LSGRGALQGQVAIVTGAGRGIGHAVAMALAREEATVVLAARTRQQLAATAAAIRESGGSALAIPMDVTQDAAVEAMVEQAIAELGRVDVLVTAAGAASFGPVVGTKPADWDPILAVNLRAVMVCCRAVLPIMVRQRRGTIINVASIAPAGDPRRRGLHCDKGGGGRLQPGAGGGASLGWGTGGGAGAGSRRYAALGRHPQLAGPQPDAPTEDVARAAVLMAALLRAPRSRS